MKALEEANRQLADGGVVAAATESYFGLLADATRPDALDALFRLKPRTSGVALLVPTFDAWCALAADIPELAARLARTFWPGPLTIAVEAKGSLDRRLTVEGTVGVRLPGPSAAARIVRSFGRPLTATSANRHGAPPATRADAVHTAFGEQVAGGDLFVFDGECPGGPPSTIVAVRKDSIFMVRAGAVGREDIEAALERAL